MQYNSWRPSCARTIFDRTVKRVKRKEFTGENACRPGTWGGGLCNPNWCPPRCRLTDCRHCLKNARLPHARDCEWPEENTRRKKNRTQKNMKIRPVREKKINFVKDNSGSYYRKFKRSQNEYPNEHLSKESSSICCCMHIPEKNKISNSINFSGGNRYGVTKVQEDEHLPAWKGKHRLTNCRESQSDVACRRERQCMCIPKSRDVKKICRSHFVNTKSFADHYENEIMSDQNLHHISPLTHFNKNSIHRKKIGASESENLAERGQINHETFNEMVLDSIRDLTKVKRKNEATRICNCEYSNHLKINEDDVTYMKSKLNEALNEIKKCNRNVEKSMTSNQEDLNHQDHYLSIVNDCQKRCSEIEKRIQKLCKDLNSFERSDRNSRRQNELRKSQDRENQNNKEGRKGSRGYFENKEERPTRDIDESSISLENNHAGGSFTEEQRNLPPSLGRPCKCKDSERSSRLSGRKGRGKDREKVKTPRTERSSHHSLKRRSKASNLQAEGTSVGSDSLKVGGACYHIRCFPSDQVLGNPKFLKCRGYKEVIDRMRKKRDFRRLTRKNYS